jgi:hypothetical protein
LFSIALISCVVVVKSDLGSAIIGGGFLVLNRVVHPLTARTRWDKTAAHKIDARPIDPAD